VSPAHRRRGGSRRSGRPVEGRATGRSYPRAARINQILREVLADTLERLTHVDERLALLTVTDVFCDPDLRHATVMFSSLGEEEAEALALVRVRLQAAVSAQVRLKRTPLLRFEADPAVAAGQRIEDLLRDIGPTGAADPVVGAPDPVDSEAPPAPPGGPGAGNGASGTP